MLDPWRNQMYSILFGAQPSPPPGRSDHREQAFLPLQGGVAISVMERVLELVPSSAETPRPLGEPEARPDATLPTPPPGAGQWAAARGEGLPS